jgi:hypothetical protein
LIPLFLGFAALADTVRVATWAPDLTRRGPGLLLRDLMSGTDPQIKAAISVIVQAQPDILLLTGVDHDHDLLALRALVDHLAKAGHGFDHLLAPAQNSGRMTALDLDGDGQLGTPEDAQGYGRFSGARAMALLSRYPVALTRDLTDVLWADLPGGRMPDTAPEVRPVQRLSSTGHWLVRADLPGGALHLALWSATPPLFGTGSRNRDRNHDETALWLSLLNQDKALPAPFVIMGLANTDPAAGAGDKAALGALLGHPAIGPAPSDPTFRGRDTRLRLSYLLPSADLTMIASGTVSPASGLVPPDLVEQASRHWLVWADLGLR